MMKMRIYIPTASASSSFKFPISIAEDLKLKTIKYRAMGKKKPTPSSINAYSLDTFNMKLAF